MHKVVPLSLAAVVGLGIAGCGSGTTTTEQVASKPAPTVTVTETVPGPTVTKEVVPPVCLKALNEADKGFKLAGEAALIMADYPSLVVRAAEAGVYQDADGLRSVTADMKSMNSKIAAVTVKIKRLRYGEYAAECRRLANQ